MLKTISFFVFGFLLILLSSCVQPLVPEEGGGNNNPPEINSFISERLVIRVGQTSELWVEATDPDGDVLTYQWFVLLGDIIGDGSNVFYSAAYCCAGINKITVTVKDSKGASVTKSLDINVDP